ncbi:beta-amyrin 11-oxidase-like [Cicer arietinum]|uniref:Beta-amyrin 11-oxidase-like n=1 Tax=Cicer arietinum TaxID=3827 RepID=A0A1S2YUR6_CICAR|nr:beta-amyrin 11-oxidase-like [Cicer arietinum]
MESEWFLLLGATLLAWYIFAKKVVRNMNEWYYDNKLRKKEYPLPPGDMGWPIIGNLWTFYKYFSSGQPDTFINNIVNKNGRGGIYKTHLFWKPGVIITTPSICKKILADDDVNFTLGYPKSLAKLTHIRKKKIKHRNFKRLIMAPMVGHNALAMYLDCIEDIVIDKLEELSSMKHPIELLNETRNITFKVIIHIFMGPFDQAIFKKCGDLFSIMSTGLYSIVPINAPFFPFRKALQARMKLNKVVESIIEERRKMIENGKIREKKYFVDILLEMDDDMGQKLEDGVIIDSLVMLLFGGHETSATTMMLSITYLTQNPLCLKKAKEEQEEIIKARPSSQKGLSITEIKKMVYLSQIIDETLRLGSNLFSIFRQTIKDVNINGYCIPKGWKVMVWTRAISMDPQYYSNPELFNPSRWDDYNPTTGTFIPFGAGPRLCPGNDLARFTITIFLHYFVLNYKLERINSECPFTNLPIPKPIDNCLANVVKLGS